jgi:hypothetical protein
LQMRPAASALQCHSTGASASAISNGIFEIGRCEKSGAPK